MDKHSIGQKTPGSEGPRRGKSLLTEVASALRAELAANGMQIDPRALRPAELVRLLNSTPLGEVLDDRLLRQHRARAGFRIGEGKTVDLFRYAAWLFECAIPRPPQLAPDVPGTGAGSEAYQAKKERSRLREAELSKSGREIGAIPAPVQLARRAAAKESFRLFCESYFAESFVLAWSPDHLKVIAKIERAVLKGGLFALAMPRGSGKTTLCEAAVLWAILYGHQEFVCLIGSDQSAAEANLENIWTALENNDALADDFPEVCLPIRKLEGIKQRRLLYNGEPIRLKHTKRRLLLPWIPGSAAAGAALVALGITGRIRGLTVQRPDGKKIRPGLVIVDDPQTDESARSPSQCEQRERILAGAIVGLAGPGKKIAGVMPCTVVRQDDMADRILDRKKHPIWQGERTRMVYAWPTGQTLWAKYAEIRAAGLREERGTGEANAFYIANRTAMDAGALVAWPERHNEDELSAIQNAMNLRFDHGDAVFFAEYQNDPLPETKGDDALLTAPQITEKLSRIPRGIVPSDCTKVTAFIDVQQQILFWLVAGWTPGFTGYVIDYGTWPEQALPYFTLNTLNKKLKQIYPRAGEEGAILAGLEQVEAVLRSREFPREGGGIASLDRLTVDAGYKTDLVYQFCRRSGSRVLPSHGKYIKPTQAPMSQWARKPGETYGHNHIITRGTGARPIPHILFDVNYWKSFVQARLATAIGNQGCLSLYGDRPERHRLIADHLTAESREKVSGRGREIDEWKLRPERSDNHWLDTLVGAAVAASIEGIALAELPATAPKERKKFSDLQRAKRDGR